MNIADIAEILDELEDEEMLKLFRILPKDAAADVFSYLEVASQQFIITSLSDREAATIIDNLMADDATDFLEEMPANIVKKLLTNASAETRRDINHLLRYPEYSAGSIMTVEYIDLKESLTVAQAIERIRRKGLDSETINICYVLDHERKLLGTAALRYLLLSRPDQTIGDIMHENVIAIHTLMDQEEVAAQFKKYDFTAMPVVDNENRMVGIITVDDIVDIIDEETTEDIEKMAAIMPSDKPYMYIALIWAAAGCALYTITDGKMVGLAEALAAGQSAAIYDVCLKTMGNVGVALAMIGVVICPITSGDTAFRSARLTLADWLKIDQDSYANRLKLCVPVLGVGAFLGIGNALGFINYTVIWRYFSWTNQTLGYDRPVGCFHVPVQGEEELTGSPPCLQPS